METDETKRIKKEAKDLYDRAMSQADSSNPHIPWRKLEEDLRSAIFNADFPVRKRLAELVESSYPGKNDCRRCGLTEQLISLHGTMYGLTHGVSVLCEKCWQELTAEEKLPYYRAAFDSWDKDWAVPVRWEIIKKAVLAGI